MGILQIAKANILRNRSHTISLFVIIMAVSMIVSIGFSVMLGVDTGFEQNLEKLNSLHSIFIMTKDMFMDSYEDLIENDSRVLEYNIGSVIYPGQVTVDYGGVIDLPAMILNLESAGTISFPEMLEADTSISKNQAIYLPNYAKTIGYQLGDEYTMVYKNKPIDFVVAGFFESNELSISNGYGVKYYVHAETYERLSRQIGDSVWIAVRFHNPYDSEIFNHDFSNAIDVDISAIGHQSLDLNLNMSATGLKTPILSFSALIVGFALILSLIMLLVVRFRVTNSIADSMHTIGALGAGGYTSRQIIAGFLLEYGIVSLVAAILGIFAAIPLFSPIRSMMSSMTGIQWSFHLNISASLISAALIVAMLFAMVLLSCRRIKKLLPVVALRGGISTNNFRRNFFPLHKGFGNVQLRLGLKNIIAYGKLYAMVALIVAGISLAITFMAVTYQNFVLDTTSFVKMVGMEIADVTLTVVEHTDADILSQEIEKLPQVHKTSMLDWVSLRIEGMNVAGFASNDYSRLETMSTYMGRFPQWDNEIAMPETLASSFGKTIGDAVKVKAGGIVQDFIISGFYSTTNNGGYVSALTLAGYQRLVPHQARNTINVYLNPGVTVEDFTETLQTNFGVVNVYKVEDNDPYAAAKTRAEERISDYLQQYDIDSVEYAAIYNGEIILSGSSTVYQIEKIVNYRDLLNAQTDSYADAIILTTQFIAVMSLVIVSLILSMTVRSIVSKRRHEFGALKAGGFATKELVTQLGISFIPSAILGAAAGCASGGLLVNPVFGAIFSSMGVKNAAFSVNPLWILVLGLVVVFITVSVAMLSARRIKHISPYELLSE